MTKSTSKKGIAWRAAAGVGLNTVTKQFPTRFTGALYDEGDGMCAWKEYLADTDPTNKQSVLAITNVSVNGTGARLYWKGGNAVTQYLELRRNLTSTTEQWLAVLTNIPPTPTTTNFLDPAGTDAVRFYRIRAVR